MREDEQRPLKASLEGQSFWQCDACKAWWEYDDSWNGWLDPPKRVSTLRIVRATFDAFAQPSSRTLLSDALKGTVGAVAES